MIMKFSPKQHAEILYELLEGKTDSEKKIVIKKLVLFLAKNKDLSLWKQIAEEFEKYYYQQKGIERVEITTADGNFQLPTSNFQKTFKKSAEIVAQKDSSLIGGIRIKIGDRMINNTIRSRLEKLKEALS